MILHLTPGSGSIELHIHDNAQVALYQPGDKLALIQADPASSSRPAPRWFLLGLTGVVCLALGYGVAARGSAPPSRVAGSPALVRPPVPPISSNIPLVPDAAPPRPNELPINGLPNIRPRAEAEPADGVPAALARQLTQAPTVVPPSATVRPPAGSGAFGLEN